MRMNTKILTLSAAVFLALTSTLRGQDANFSQFYANPLYLNPAFAGAFQCPRVNLNHRNQYPNYSVFQTYSGSYDQYVEALRGGIGLMVLQDEAANGILSNTQVDLMYSYHLKVSRDFSVLAGLQASYRQTSLNWNQLTFPDEIDPFRGAVLETQESPPENTNVSNFDVSAGIIGYSRRFYIGIAAHHLTQPDVSFYVADRLPVKFTGHAGFTIPLGRKRLATDIQNFIIPNVVYQRQGPFDQTTLSLAFSRGAISGGLGFRTTSTNADAVVLMAGYGPEDGKWRIGYSYDVSVSSVASNLGGAHEVSLSYQFPCFNKKKQLQAINCPKF